MENLKNFRENLFLQYKNNTRDKIECVLLLQGYLCCLIYERKIDSKSAFNYLTNFSDSLE